MNPEASDNTLYRNSCVDGYVTSSVSAGDLGSVICRG